MAIWAAVIGGGISLLGGMLSNDDNNNGAQKGANSPAYYDPYAPYRANAAQQLQALMQDPIKGTESTPTYIAMLQAATRQAASQGYNGSGNALVAAANAGGQAYQQTFNNLAMLSGAEQSPAQAAALASQQGNYNQQYQQQMNNQMWGNIGSVVGRTIAGGSGSGWGSGGNSGDWGTYEGLGGFFGP